MWSCASWPGRIRRYRPLLTALGVANAPRFLVGLGEAARLELSRFWGTVDFLLVDRLSWCVLECTSTMEWTPPPDGIAMCQDRAEAIQSTI